MLEFCGQVEIQDHGGGLILVRSDAALAAAAYWIEMLRLLDWNGETPVFAEATDLVLNGRGGTAPGATDPTRLTPYPDMPNSALHRRFLRGYTPALRPGAYWLRVTDGEQFTELIGTCAQVVVNPRLRSASVYSIRRHFPVPLFRTGPRDLGEEASL